MAFEMGESLMHSWMKHIHGCHVVQTNWKISRSWELQNQTEIFELVEKAMKKMSIISNGRKSRVEILTKRVLRQFECDCVGVRISGNDTEVMGAEVAIHTAGLHYTPSKSSSFKKSEKFTAHKVIQKLFVIAIAFRGYLGIKKAKIYFATPKILPSFRDDVKKALDEFVKFWNDAAKGLDYSFELIADEEFNRRILKPVIDKVEYVADMSELFMRCVQLENVFEDIDVDCEGQANEYALEDKALERAHEKNLRRALEILGIQNAEKGEIWESIKGLYDACTELCKSGKDDGGWLRMALREEYRRNHDIAERPTMREMEKELYASTNSVRWVPGTEEVRKQTTRQKPQKGARNGLQETRSSREERS